MRDCDALGDHAPFTAAVRRHATGDDKSTMFRFLIIVLFGIIGSQFFAFFETYLIELELDIARQGGAAALKSGEPTPTIEDGARRLQEAVPPYIWVWFEEALDLTPTATSGAGDPWYDRDQPDADAQTEMLSAPPPETPDRDGRTGYDNGDREDMNERIDGLRTQPIDTR